MIIHGFEVGAAYQTHTPNSPNEYLEAVLGAEATIAKHQVTTPDGIYWKTSQENWREVQGDIDLSFYSGHAGILYFYLKLWEVTRDQNHYETVLSGARYLSLHWKDFFTQKPVFHMMDLPGSSQGLYFGVAGLGLVLTEVYQATGDVYAKEGALDILEYYLEQAKEDETGTYWTGLTGLAMDGGILMLLLNYYQAFPSKELRNVITSAANHYLAQGQHHSDGALEFDGCHTFTDVSWPNYEFGTAGAGYLLTLLHEFTGEKKYLEAAIQTTEYLKTIQVPQSKGYLIPHDVKVGVKQEPVFFLSSCHGPGGNAKLYYKLYQLTSDTKWLTEINAMIDGIESTGAPERQSIGLWNTLCFCCGHAGFIQFFLGLYHNFHDDRYLDLAKRAANIILGEQEKQEDGSVIWPMAFWRTRPDFLTQDLGYYDGAAGIASSLLQIYLQETSDFHWNRLVDDPF